MDHSQQYQPQAPKRQHHHDVASMSAARVGRRPGQRPPAPTKHRDGFSLIDKTPIDWKAAQVPNIAAAFQDVTYHVSIQEACARIAFDRPHVMHAFRPRTIREIQQALEHAENHPAVMVVLLDSNNHTEYTPAFCAGGDQRARSKTGGGYQDDTEIQPKLRVLELQRQMRACPKPILCVVDGYAIGGGHILHMCSDLTLASDRSVFGQTGPRMGSFDAGYGCSRLARMVGQKKAREIWMLAKFYDAHEAMAMGLINEFVPATELPALVAQWVRRMVMNSPTALAACKAALNADETGDIQQLGGELTALFYKSAESQEGRDAFLERRAPDFRSKL